MNCVISIDLHIHLVVDFAGFHALGYFVHTGGLSKELILRPLSVKL
jgi:hypothetical protein